MYIYIYVYIYIFISRHIVVSKMLILCPFCDVNKTCFAKVGRPFRNFHLRMCLGFASCTNSSQQCRCSRCIWVHPTCPRYPHHYKICILFFPLLAVVHLLFASKHAKCYRLPGCVVFPSSDCCFVKPWASR